MTPDELKEKEKKEEQAKLEKEKADRIVRALDKNKDGFVSKEEFVKGCKELDIFEGIASGLKGDVLWGELTSGSRV